MRSVWCLRLDRFPERRAVNLLPQQVMTATTILWRKPRVRLILLAALVLAIAPSYVHPYSIRWVPEADRLGSLVEDEEGHWISYTPGQGEHRNHPATRLSGDQFFLLGTI